MPVVKQSGHVPLQELPRCRLLGGLFDPPETQLRSIYEFICDKTSSLTRGSAGVNYEFGAGIIAPRRMFDKFPRADSSQRLVLQ